MPLIPLGTTVRFSRLASSRRVDSPASQAATRDEPDRVGATVVCCLPPALAIRVRRLVPSALMEPTAVELPRELRRRGVALVIADPCMDGGACLAEMLYIRQEFPSVTVAAYTSLNHEAVKAVLMLARAGVSDVVFFDHDDSLARFTGLIEQAISRPLAAAVLAELTPHLGLLPPLLQRAIHETFRTPARFRSADDLAGEARMTRGTLYRHLRSIRIPSTRPLVVSGRLVRAITLLQDPGRTARQVAAHCGFRRVEDLTAKLHDLAGLRIGDVRRGVDALEVGRVIARRIRSSSIEP